MIFSFERLPEESVVVVVVVVVVFIVFVVVVVDVGASGELVFSKILF